MLPVDLTTILTETLAADNRANDFLLHASSHLLSPLRHAQLDVAGAPRNPEALLSAVRLQTGTMWHSKWEDIFRRRKLPVMCEVDMTPYMPEGWAGTLDWLFWSTELSKFVLGDLKTIKPEGLTWIEKDGAKKEHLWQLSAYYYALRDAGFPIHNEFYVYYLPMGQGGNAARPLVMDCWPLDEFLVKGTMSHRWERVSAYVDTIKQYDKPSDAYWLTSELEPPAPREQAVMWDTKLRRFDLKLKPHYTSMWCPYSEELCGCGKDGITKIGHWEYTSGDGSLDGKLAPDWATFRQTYIPRKGFEEIEPTVTPSIAQYRSKLK